MPSEQGTIGQNTQIHQNNNLLNSNNNLDIPKKDQN